MAHVKLTKVQALVGSGVDMPLSYIGQHSVNPIPTS